MSEEDEKFIEETEEFLDGVDAEVEEQKTLKGAAADPALLKQTDEQKAERYQDILVGLGFKLFDNKEKGIACKLKTKELHIGRTFTEKNPTGKFWAKCLKDGIGFGTEGEFVKEEELKEIPEIALFYRIREGELQIPELEVLGKIVGQTERAIQVQFTEFGQIKTEWWGLGAVKTDEDSQLKYIPAGFSKQTPKYEAKMTIPRVITLPNYEEELKSAALISNGHQPQPQQPEPEYIPDEVATKQHEKEEVEQKTTEETAGKQIIDDMGYFIVKVKNDLLPLFNTDEMTQAEVNELIRTLAISAGIEYGYRIRNRRY